MNKIAISKVIKVKLEGLKNYNKKAKKNWKRY